MASPIGNKSSLSLIQGSQSPIIATQTATTLLAHSQFLVAQIEGKFAEPSRPILYKPFGFLKSIDLRTIGLKLEDIPYDFGWSLVLFRESDACMKSGEEQEPIREYSEEIGAKDKFFLPKNDLGDICLTESHSFGLFPE